LTRRNLLKSSVLAGAASRLQAAKMDVSFKLGIITDEISEKLEDALDFISGYNLHGCELREIWDNNLMNAPQGDLDRAKKLLADHSVKVSDIASPIFKWNMPAMPAHANEKRDTFKASFTEQDADALLEKSFRLAHFFGTPKVRIFSYWRVEDPEKAYTGVCGRLSQAAKLAAANDIVLVLENEHSCNIGTGRELGKILKEINSPHLRGVWDPGNAVMLGEIPFPDGYQAVKGLFPHMHIKDVWKKAGKLDWAPVGSGVIDFKGQFQALHADRYEGTMSLETHYLRDDKSKVESTRESLQGLLKVI